MNNVKTNRTFEQYARGRWGTRLPSATWSAREEVWYDALESVVQEPALTREQIIMVLASAIQRGQYLTNQLADALLLVGRIPAHATGETPPQFVKVKGEFVPTEDHGDATPQEGELTDDWEEWLDEQLMRIREKRLNLTDAVTLITDRHQQALSAREQAVRHELAQRLEAMQNLYNMADNAIGDLRAELAAEKLANEGKYAIGERVGVRQIDDLEIRVYACEVEGSLRTSEPNLVYKLEATLTPAEKAEAWVKWYCEVGEKAARYSEFDAWKELATRQANGETIDQIYAEAEGR